jgi:VWFA-related protein
MQNLLGRPVIVVFLTSVALAGQEPQAPPTFRASVQSIEVDVRVTDKSGNAVRGLTVDDFSILEDGVKQQVNAFAFVDLPVDSQKARAAAMKVAEPDVTTNVGEGRTYVMVFTDGGPEVRYLARLFVEQAIGPHDQMALFRARGNMSDAQGLTKSRNAMLAAIDRLTRDFEGLPADDNSMRVTFQVLEELCESLGLISGRRKVVLWFDPPSLINVSGDEPGLASKWFAQRDMVRAAIRNNVAFYVVSSQHSELGVWKCRLVSGLWRRTPVEMPSLTQTRLLKDFSDSSLITAPTTCLAMSRGRSTVTANSMSLRSA